MLISELVTALEAVKAEHGDLPVFWMAYNEADFDWELVSSVEVETGTAHRSEFEVPNGMFVSVS